MEKQLKGMVGIVTLTPIAGAALSGIGAAGMGGIGAATQSLVAIGHMGYVAAASGAKKLFKW